MEFVYFLIFLISFLIKDIYCVFMKKNHKSSIKDEIILFTSEEPSLLQCAQRCRFIDKNAIVDFKNAKCTCLKYNDDEGQEQQGTLTGVFVNQVSFYLSIHLKAKERILLAYNSSNLTFYLIEYRFYYQNENASF